jgi:hypothetical protein
MWVLGGSGNTITGYTVTNSQVTAIGGQGTWFKFELPKQSGSLSETLGVNSVSQSEITLGSNKIKYGDFIKKIFSLVFNIFLIWLFVKLISRI